MPSRAPATWSQSSRITAEDGTPVPALRTYMGASTSSVSGPAPETERERRLRDRVGFSRIPSRRPQRLGAYLDECRPTRARLIVRGLDLFVFARRQTAVTGVEVMWTNEVVRLPPRLRARSNVHGWRVRAVSSPAGIRCRAQGPSVVVNEGAVAALWIACRQVEAMDRVGLHTTVRSRQHDEQHAGRAGAPGGHVAALRRRGRHLQRRVECGARTYDMRGGQNRNAVLNWNFSEAAVAPVEPDCRNRRHNRRSSGRANPAIGEVPPCPVAFPSWRSMFVG